jgi:ABC-type multidrug transport system permease subunit
VIHGKQHAHIKGRDEEVNDWAFATSIVQQGTFKRKRITLISTFFFFFLSLSLSFFFFFFFLFINFISILLFLSVIFINNCEVSTVGYFSTSVAPFLSYCFVSL